MGYGLEEEDPKTLHGNPHEKKTQNQHVWVFPKNGGFYPISHDPQSHDHFLVGVFPWKLLASKELDGDIIPILVSLVHSEGLGLKCLVGFLVV